MNYEEANAVKELAAPVNKVLERLDVECPECKGKGTKWYKLGGRTVAGEKQRVRHSCPSCDGEGKVKYKWQPKMGEWYYQNGKLHLITDPLVAIERMEHEWNKSSEKAIPILEWEVIEGILEKAGYSVEAIRYHKDAALCRLYGDHEKYTSSGKDRLIAVYEAVLALGKELK